MMMMMIIIIIIIIIICCLFLGTPLVLTSDFCCSPDLGCQALLLVHLGFAVLPTDLHY